MLRTPRDRAARGSTAIGSPATGRTPAVRRAAYEPAALLPHVALAGEVLKRLRLARVALDAGCVVGGHLLALVLRFHYHLFEVTEARTSSIAHIPSALLSSGVLLVIIGWHRLYDEDTLFPGGREFARVGKAIVQTVVIFSAVALLSRGFFLSRSWFGLAMLLSWVCVASQRLVLRKLIEKQRAKGSLRRPIILVSPSVKGSVEKDWAVASVDEFSVIDNVDPAAAVALLSQIADARRGKERRMGIPGIVMRAGEIDDDDLWRILLHAGEAGCPVYVQSQVRSVASDRLTFRPVGGRTIVKVGPPALTGFQSASKRMFDVVVSGTVMIVAAPVYVLLALAVVATSGRPIFYGQERVGRNGKPFRMWKFRTMRVDAESRSGPVWAAEKDPRRTRLGSVLRKLSIDELPQFWNVFTGKMSLVGPRPERPVFVSEFEGTIAWYPYRHRMRPGITGWAQANGLRGNTSLDDRVEYDNWYIEHWSVGLDVKICLLTVLEVFRGRNAY